MPYLHVNKSGGWLRTYAEDDRPWRLEKGVVIYIISDDCEALFACWYNSPSKDEWLPAGVLADYLDENRSEITATGSGDDHTGYYLMVACIREMFARISTA